LVAGAVATKARVRLAEGDAIEAARLFGEALQAWASVGAPYEEAVARLGLAEAYAATGSRHQAALEQQAARATLDRIAIEPSTAAAPAAGDADRRPEDPSEVRNRFRLEGDYWSVEFDGRTVRIRDLKGMRYLARLLAEPERELHVLDLVAAEAARTGTGERGPEGAHVDLGDAGAMLDAQAKEAYRRRLAEIDEDLDDARASSDAVREAQADLEREFLVRELSRAVGLGGRDRRAGSASERARVAVTRAVRQAMARISEQHTDLGEHLDRTIRTGTYCSYAPDPRVPANWDV
jgi:hypothetical protein